MGEYLFPSKGLAVEIKYGLSAFPEKQLLIVLVNGIHWVSQVQTAGPVTWVTVLHPQNSLEGGERTLLWQMRNERQSSHREGRAWGQRQDCGTQHSLSPNPVYTQALIHTLEGVKGEVCQECAKDFVRIAPVSETVKADVGTATPL